MKYYKDDDVLPTVLIAMLVGCVVLLSLHHKNETAYLRKTIESQRETIALSEKTVDASITAIKYLNKMVARQAKQIKNYKSVLHGMPMQEFRNGEGEKL